MSKEKNKNQQLSGNPFPEMEEEVLNFWDKGKIFKKSVEKEASKGPRSQGRGRDYVFYDGPPFGTGEPHYGHLLSSISKDVVPRYWTMKGYRVERRWGWDCHGLPIENIIEKDLGISGKKEIEKIGIAKFNEACRERVLEYADIWEVMIKRIARWVEFKNSYKTMDLDYMESVWWAFKELWGKELIYQGRKVLLYCPRCETPISNFEVAMDNSYKDITEPSVYVKFKIKKESLAKKEIFSQIQNDNFYILAWTTTPWTLPGNVALAVGKDIDYVLVKAFDRYDTETGKTYYNYVILAKDIYEKIGNGDKEDPMYQKLYGEPIARIRKESRRAAKGGEAKLIQEFKGKELIGLEYEPLFDVPALKESGKKVYYITAADFVTIEDGTGVVHTAVVYGEDDYNLGLKLDLPIVPAIDEKGYFNETVPKFVGIYFKETDKLIIEDLEKRGLLFDKEDYTHSYPFCHRCETQLFYNAIPAWFLSIEKIRKQLLEQNEKINWYPRHLKHGRFAQGIEQAPDWNISRNRYFATPIPIWQCDKCQEREVIGSVKELKEKSNKNDITDIHSHYIDKLIWPCKCGGKMQRISEVFDCWVESGSMSFAQLHYPFANKEKFEKNFPSQYISEYISQTRAWFYVMHVMSTALFNSNSFENVVTTGVIFNEKGEKMSKSKGNYPDPRKVIDEYGADALRFYLMSSSLMHAENLFFNGRELRDVFRKNIMLVWNVLKFYELFNKNHEALSPDLTTPQRNSDNILDKWILARLNQLINEVADNMDNYDLPRAMRPITDFIDDLSTWYLRRSRDRFKGDNKKDKEMVLKTTGFVLLQLSKVMAPFAPFIAEQIWQKVSGNDFKDENKSVHLEEWPPGIESTEERFGQWEYQKSLSCLEGMDIVRQIVELALAKRDEAGIKVRQPLSKLIVKYKLVLKSKYIELIKDEVNVKEVEFVKSRGDLEVKLDKSLTDELKEEGIKREIVRFINDMRKKTEMTIKDRIIIYWHSSSNEIEKSIINYKDDIIKETLANEIKRGKTEGLNLSKKININGTEAWLGIKKI